MYGVGRCFSITLLVVELLLLAGVASPDAGAAEATVAVTATVNARTVARFGDTAISFDPIASAGSLAVYSGPDGARFHVWKGSGRGASVEVSSNVSWTGTLSANPLDEVSSAAISAGALRYALAEPHGYADCENAVPLQPAPVAWAAHRSRGHSDFSFYYCLRTEAGESPAAFAATIVYAVSPSQLPSRAAAR